MECVVLFSCLPGLWQSFLHRPSNRLTTWTCLCGDTIGHPWRHHAYCLPQALCSFTVHICNLKGPQGASMQLEPRGPMQGAGRPNSFLRAIWKCLLFHGLFNVLFIDSCMAFFFFFNLWRDNKAKIFLSLGGWDCTGPRAMTVPVAHGHRDPARGWPAGLHPTSYFGFWGGSLGWYTPLLAWRFFRGCYVLRPLGKSATCSFGGSWFSSVWTSHTGGHSVFTVPFECWLLTRH